MSRTDDMPRPTGLSAAERFFWDNAGYSWDRAFESAAQDRERCARNLAAAEGIAREAGYTFEWDVSDIDSSDFSDEVPAWPLYDCLMRDVRGRVVQSLSGCDFGKDASGPYGDYRRVIEAELAAQEVDAVLREVAP